MMKKFTTILLASSLALGLAACNKNQGRNDGPNGPENGNTYASLSISTLKSAGLKADVDENGRDKEGKLNKLDLIAATSMSWNYAASQTAGSFYPSGVTGEYTVDAFPATAGTQNLALVINRPVGLVINPATAPTQVVGDADQAIAEIAKYSSDDNFVMTSATVNKEVKSNVSKAEAEAATDETKNLFAFNLERIVAQGFVSKATGISGDTEDGLGTIALNDLTYSAINGATKSYLFADKAGDRQRKPDHTYGTFTSWVSEQSGLTMDAAKKAEDAKPYLIRLGNLGSSNSALGGYAAIAVSENAYKTGGTETQRGIYFFENSVTTLDDATKKDGYARLAHAKVYATYTPKNAYTVKADAVAHFAAEPNCGIWYKKTTTTTSAGATSTTTITYTDRTVSQNKPDATGLTTGQEWVEGRAYYDASDLEYKALPSGQTSFYVGAQDKQVYASIEAAQTAIRGQKVHTYKDGRCGYQTLWHRGSDDADFKTVANADTRRNNIYALEIGGFAKLGMNFDPKDPNDPNLPKTDDPDENPDPNNHTYEIETKDVFMKVKATVLPWNFVKRSVTLGK